MCITSKSSRPQKLDVSMQFDHGKPRVLERKRFEYVQDPTIELAYSGASILILLIFYFKELNDLGSTPFEHWVIILFISLKKEMKNSFKD